MECQVLNWVLWHHAMYLAVGTRYISNGVPLHLKIFSSGCLSSMCLPTEIMMQLNLLKIRLPFCWIKSPDCNPADYRDLKEVFNVSEIVPSTCGCSISFNCLTILSITVIKYKEAGFFILLCKYEGDKSFQAQMFVPLGHMSWPTYTSSFLITL